MTPAERGQLRTLHERMGGLAETGDHDCDVLANGDFHSLLYAGAHNAVIDEIARNLRRRLMPYRSIQFQVPGRLARDATAANSAMLVHRTIVEDAFEMLDAGGVAVREAAGERARDRRTRSAAPVRVSKVRLRR